MSNPVCCANCNIPLIEFNDAFQCANPECKSPTYIAILKKKKDAINPDYYKEGGVECIDAIKAALTSEQFIGFLRGTQIKYLWRAGKKDDVIQDLKKAQWYANKEIKTLQSVNPS